MAVFEKHGASPAQIVLLGFLALILTGTALLMLPFASRSGQVTPFLDALFTATSATCVTGLVVVDTFTYWSGFGQFVILALIQVGGMGVVTMAIAVSVFTGKKIGLRQRVIMQESISAPQMGGIIRMTGFILKTSALLELAGAVMLYTRFYHTVGPVQGIWYSIFHSVSAFCNAGFDLMGKNAAFSSLTGYVDDPVVNITIMLLIFIGGIGFFVWQDVTTHKLQVHHYHLQTKIVLITSFILLALPLLYFFFYEFAQPQWASFSGGQRFWASLFQAVTPRTAGFNTVDYTLLQSPSVMLMVVLMLIGGSPGSTAGGFKTTTFATFFLCVRSVFQRKDSMQIFGRRLPSETLRSAVSLITLYLTLFLTSGAIICCIEGLPLSYALFETASAIGTVGLTLGITTQLGGVSRLILIFLMYFGRMGGLTMIYAMASGRTPAPYQMPQERLTIG